MHRYLNKQLHSDPKRGAGTSWRWDQNYPQRMQWDSLSMDYRNLLCIFLVVGIFYSLSRERRGDALNTVVWLGRLRFIFKSCKLKKLLDINIFLEEGRCQNLDELNCDLALDQSFKSKSSHALSSFMNCTYVLTIRKI